ncbi:MAG: hypothetical protein QXT71_06195 [Thermoplasmata archaeon]
MRKEIKIRDNTGKIIYYIIDEGNGKESVYDRTGKLIGYTTSTGSAICEGRYVGNGGASIIIAEYEMKYKKK